MWTCGVSNYSGSDSNKVHEEKVAEDNVVPRKENLGPSRGQLSYANAAVGIQQGIGRCKRIAKRTLLPKV
ncbi:unnamed protein product [Urochloa humidicola]